MHDPVRCLHCRTVYDMAAVQIVQRYSDCSVWRCPGCRLQVDDRCLTGWGGRRDIERIHPRGLDSPGYPDIYGRWLPARVAHPDDRTGLYPL
jgi:hypothetical protein